MANLTGEEKSRYVNQTFTRIARRYDLMNRLMSGGMDIFWRKEAIRLAALNKGDLVLDLGSGTGDIAREARLKIDEKNIIATDFTYEMLYQGKNWGAINRCNADALDLPYPDQSFNVVISGFLLRNVGNVRRVLQEQNRVLKPGGRIIVLDTTRPRKNLFSPLVQIYLRYMMPFLGTLITGDREAYTYLPESTQKFLLAEDLAEILKQSGFDDINFLIRMFGTVAIHSGYKAK
jgi:demethylmenaquinone methyltransferase/2-methoxy-6-polyprenyl-1,4-benzoquinol methylase